MRLLITTQALDQHDSNLGFFVEWVREFSKYYDEVTVVCLRKGKYELPSNVSVVKLGSSRIARAVGFLLFSLVCRYDAVFMHMNPEYALVSGWLWRIMRKPVALWYAHKSVTAKLQAAMPFITDVCTVSEESFKLPTQKLHIVGHGIDTNLFAYGPNSMGTTLRLFAVGRIAQSKHLIEMLAALDILEKRNVGFQLSIVGAPLTDTDRSYEQQLKHQIVRRPYAGSVHMLGAMDHAELPEYMRGQNIALNFSETGNMDKVGLEALAMGIPLVSCNPPFRTVLATQGLFFELIDAAEAAADAIQKAAKIDTAPLSQWVRRHHSLQSLIPKLVAILKGDAAGT